MKAFFKKSGTTDHGAKRHVMGAASGAFADNKINAELKTSVHLAFFLFGKLDRKVISAMEVSLNLRSAHRENIRRFIGQISNQTASLPEIVKPHRNASHNTRYKIFGDVCKIAAGNPRFDMGFIKRLITIGKALGLSEDEVYRWIKQTRLAE